MANRLMREYSLSFENQVKIVYAKVAIGATGAPTLSAANSKGIVSVTRNSAGLYTFVFGTAAGNLDTYVKLLGVSVTFQNASAIAAAPITYVKTLSISTAGTASVQIGCVNGSLAATDPASGETMFVQFTFGDSGV
jgi:hypothetical protein